MDEMDDGFVIFERQSIASVSDCGISFLNLYILHV